MSAVTRRSFGGFLTLFATTPSVAASSAWRPIDTCPTDGTPFLAKRVEPKSRIHQVTYKHIKLNWTPSPGYPSHSAHFPGWPATDIGPSHWMPTP